ncbi:hypothetical protein FRZ00_21520 [Streptomyces mobaraensis]|uniref:Uncharacterized protein n=1 Tax=Streptomyces mobaraensis TaxID=35621 RepID=A0A5N5W3X3_STRMB|nr:hypothetical protein FRZ00_21520 [Streptomyces mobaraensis]
MTAVPLALPTTGGLMAVLALVADKGVPRAEVVDFVTRYGFATRDEAARAADSQARWLLEPDGRVTFQLLCADGASGIALPSDPRIHQWAAMARLGGGTVSLMMLPGLPSAETQAIARRLSPNGGNYWHLSVGCLTV